MAERIVSPGPKSGNDWPVIETGVALGERTVNAMTKETKPFGDTNLPLEAFWVEMWMMPITMMAQFMGMSRTVVDDEPEIDRECKDCQLPVPNKIR